MDLGSNTGRCCRFGPFELDVRSGELRKQGVRVRLQEQPLQILNLLLAQPGEVVLREEIQALLWHDRTSVEFDHGINVAIRRLRVALGDSAETPRYVETVARRGYRFIAAIERDLPEDPAQQSAPRAPAREDRHEVVSSPPAAEGGPVTAWLVSVATRVARWNRRRAWIGVVAGLAAIGLAAFFAVPSFWTRAPATSDIVPPRHLALTGSPVLSPNGLMLVAPVADRSNVRMLWVRSLRSGEDRLLTATTGASGPFWSADSGSIGFFSGNEVKVVTAKGERRASFVRRGCHFRRGVELRWDDSLSHRTRLAFVPGRNR